MIQILSSLPKLLSYRVDPHKSVPSILRQTPYPCGFYKFPPRHKVQFFNPGLVEWMGHRWLVPRRRRHAMHPGRNDIVMCRLSNNQIADERPIKFYVLYSDEHWEDPRAINVRGQLYISYCNFRTYSPRVAQGIAKINSWLQADSVNPVYGFNGPHLMANTGWEKNWLWFEPNEDLHFIYSPAPHVVVRVNKKFQMNAEYKAGNGVQWHYGLARGGTPPVYVEEDNLYWTFFHSSLELGPRAPRRRYYIGAYAFEPWPPFRPVLMTQRPLLVGSEHDPRELSAPLCVFPCGSLLDKGTWLVTFGVNDCACAWIKIPHDDIRRNAYTIQ